METDLDEALKRVTAELHDLYIPTEVGTVEKPVTPSQTLSFYRKYVQKNVPVKITGCTDDWAAVTKWTDEYLSSKLEDTEVTVAITPNGLADAICDGQFTLPFEKKVKFSELVTELNSPAEGRVLYLQQQNNSFNTEFPKLMDDIDPAPKWSSQVFGTELDAVNFWMGDGRAITSLHKDPYENVYSVVRGSKTFTLFPPCDRLHLIYRYYPLSRYDEGGDLIPEDGSVPWIDIDQREPLCGDNSNLHPVVVTVRAGETLYLPSYWFHHVTQSHSTIAINYWYDIDYGPAYGLFKMYDELARLKE